MGRPGTGGPRVVRRWLAEAIAGCLIVVPFAVAAWGQRGAVSWLARPTVTTAGQLVLRLGAGGALSAVILTAFAGYGVARTPASSQGKPSGLLAWLCLPWLLLPPVILIAVSQLKPLYEPRYVVFVVPPVVLLAGAGLAALPVAWWAGMLGIFVLLVLPAQRAVRRSDGTGQNLRALGDVMQARARKSDALIYWWGNDGTRGIEPSWGISSPGFSIPRNVALQKTAAQQDSLAGLGIPLPALHRRLATFRTVWVLEQQHFGPRYINPSVLPRRQFRQEARYHEPGFWLVRYGRVHRPASRTAPAAPVAGSGHRPGEGRSHLCIAPAPTYHANRT